MPVIKRVLDEIVSLLKCMSGQKKIVYISAMHAYFPMLYIFKKLCYQKMYYIFFPPDINFLKYN